MEFKGYWSSYDKEIWKKVNWSERNYEDYPVDGDTFRSKIYIYGLGDVVTKEVEFQKFLRANPIYPPYYRPIYTTELMEYMQDNHLCYPSYDGRTDGCYQIHDRFETAELNDMLSR